MRSNLPFFGPFGLVVCAFFGDLLNFGGLGRSTVCGRCLSSLERGVDGCGAIDGETFHHGACDAGVVGVSRS